MSSPTFSAPHHIDPSNPQTASPPRTFLTTRLPSPILPILLRNPLPTDAPAYYNIITNPAKTRLDRSPNQNQIRPTKSAPSSPTRRAQLTIFDIDKRIAEQRADAAEPVPKRINLLVIDTRTDQVVGLGGFGAIHAVARSEASSSGMLPFPSQDGKDLRIGDAGIMLTPSSRGQGFAQEAMRLTVEFGFEELRLDEVTISMLEVNRPMVRVVEALGWGLGRTREEKRVLGKTGEVEVVFRMGREEYFDRKRKEKG